MGDFKTMLGGFATLATQLTGLQTPQAHMPTKVTDPKKKGRLEFRVIACKSVNSNSDDFRETYDVGSNTIIITSVGFRHLTIQVKFIGEDNRPSQDALFYLERLGDRLAWPSSLATLRALDMGLIERGSFLDLSKVFSAEDRQGSIGVKEFRMVAVVTEIVNGPDHDPMSWIETVEFYSDTLDDVDGEPAPAALQVSGTVTRP